MFLSHYGGVVIGSGAMMTSLRIDYPPPIMRQKPGVDPHDGFKTRRMSILVAPNAGPYFRFATRHFGDLSASHSWVRSPGAALYSLSRLTLMSSPAATASHTAAERLPAKV